MTDRRYEVTMHRFGRTEIDELRERGYVVVEGFLTPEELAAAQSNVAQYFPSSWPELAGGSEKWPELDRTGDGVAELPFKGTALNNLSTHPELIRFAREFLVQEHVVLTQSICWAKYAGRDDFTQPLHLDWHDNSLAMPRRDDLFGQLHMILYYSDITPGLSPTAVVPLNESADRPLVPWSRSEVADPELYRREHAIHAPAGALLCFTGRTFHRCTGFELTEGVRFSHHLAWRGAGHEWMSWRGWAQYADQLPMIRWMQKATPDQRSVLGFPPPGHPYWNGESIMLVSARYPGMDMTPYIAGAEC